MTVFRLFTTGVATNQTVPSQKNIQYISTSFTYGHPKMADVESGKNVFCRLNCLLSIMYFK